MKNLSLVVGFPFVSHVNQEKRPIIENPTEFLKKVYSTPFYANGYNIFNTGFYKDRGYKYDFRPFLKIYLYKQHGSWFEAYAPNKTLLRSITISKIEKIIEITY